MHSRVINRHKSLIIRLLKGCIVLVTLASIRANTFLPIDNTFIWWVIFIVMLTTFVFAKKYFIKKDSERYSLFIKIIVLWNLVCIIRGCFVADNYWEWKNLFQFSMVLLLPLSVFTFTNEFIVSILIRTWLKFALPAFFIFFFTFKYGDAAGRYLVPISFLLLFFPILSGKWKVIVGVMSLFVFLGDLSARSNIIKFLVPFLLGFIYYYRKSLPTVIIRYCQLMFLILPFVLLILALTGTFNVFKMDEYLGDVSTSRVINGEVKEQNLASDTRTFIYLEALSSSVINGYVAFGRTPARGYDSLSFGTYAFEELHTGHMERASSEVSILNVYTWTGIVGVALYFYIFFMASSLAINKSANIHMKIIGLYVAFRWSYAWVEDFSNFDLSYLFLWLLIGMCFSKSFRSMSNTEFREWVLDFFKYNYYQGQTKMINRGKRT